MRLQYATAYRGCDEEIVRFYRIVLEISSDTVAAASLRPKSQSAQQKLTPGEYPEEQRLGVDVSVVSFAPRRKK